MLFSQGLTEEDAKPIVKRLVSKYVDRWMANQGNSSITKAVRLRSDEIAKDIGQLNMLMMQVSAEKDQKVQKVIADMERFERSLASLHEEFASHQVVLSRTAELAQAAADDFRMAVEACLSEVKEVHHASKDIWQEAREARNEMRQFIAEDFLRLATDRVHKLDDLCTSAWRGQSEDDGGDVLQRAVSTACSEVTKSVTSVPVPLDIKSMRVDESYSLQLSVWDSSLFFCTGYSVSGINFQEQCLLGFAFVVNVLLQATLCCVVVALGISSMRFTDENLEGLRIWRTLSKDFDKVGVCELDYAMDTSYLQLSAKEVLDEYFQQAFFGMQWGPLLTIVVITVWTGTVVNMSRDLLDMTAALWALTDWTSSHMVILVGLKDCTIVSIPPLRLVWMSFVVASQLVILVILCVHGSMWLVNTSVVTELLLNAVSLSFITDTDEILFSTMLPGIIKGLTAKSEPLPLHDVRSSSTLFYYVPPMRCMVSLCLVGSVVTYFWSVPLHHFRQRLELALSTMCPEMSERSVES